MKNRIKKTLVFILSFSLIFTLSIKTYGADSEDLLDKKEEVVDEKEEVAEKKEQAVEKKIIKLEESEEPEELEELEEEELEKPEELKESEESEEQGELKEPEESEEPKKSKEPKKPKKLEKSEEPNKTDKLEKLEEPEEEISLLSITSKVDLYSESFINGENIIYDVIIENKGNVELHDISIADDLGLLENITKLDAGEKATVKGNYSIDPYNELKEIGNNIYISTIFENKELSMNLSFIADIEHLKGSIKITNLVDNLKDSDLEFDVFVKGPDGSEYVLSLKDRESREIQNLPLGDYSVYSIAPMNYKAVADNIAFTLSADNLQGNVAVHHSLNNESWFYGDNDKSENIFKVNNKDITYDPINLQAQVEDKRIDSITMETETLMEESKDIIKSEQAKQAKEPEKSEKPETLESLDMVVPDDKNKEADEND